jgi:hypothetical protein
MYGTAAGVAALSSMWTRAGLFYDDSLYDTATKPSLTQVESWLADVSSSLDICLSDEGFITPVVAVEVLPSLNHLVESIVKDLVDFSHGAGRFFTERRLEAGASPMMVIDKELSDWVKRKSVGLEAMGVPKRGDITGRKVATFDIL